MKTNANSNISIPDIGCVIKTEFLEPLEISQHDLANAIGIPAHSIKKLLNGEEIINANIDLRLTKYFGLSEGYFLRLQSNFDILKTKRKIFNILDKIQPVSIKK